MTDELEQRKKDDLKEIDRALSLLSEHFDAVQIFASRHRKDAEGTFNLQKGTGNWFTRYGHVREWLLKQDESARVEERSMKPEEPYDDRGF